MEKLRPKQGFFQDGEGLGVQQVMGEKSVTTWESSLPVRFGLRPVLEPFQAPVFSSGEFQEPAWRADSQESFVPRELPRRQRLVDLGHTSSPRARIYALSPNSSQILAATKGGGWGGWGQAPQWERGSDEALVQGPKQTSPANRT